MKVKRLLMHVNGNVFIAEMIPDNSGVRFFKFEKEKMVETWFSSIIVDEIYLFYYKSNPLGFDLSKKSYNSKWGDVFTHEQKEISLITPQKSELFVQVKHYELIPSCYIIGISDGKSTKIIAKSVESNGILNFKFC